MKPRLRMRFMLSVLIIVATINSAYAFKYVALSSKSSQSNVSILESDNRDTNQLNSQDNVILENNDQEDGHAKVVKSISTLLAESLNKNIGHFQYIQDNKESDSLREASLHLSISKAHDSTDDDDKIPCSAKKNQPNNNLQTFEASSNEQDPVIVQSSPNAINISNITAVTLKSKTVLNPFDDNETLNNSAKNQHGHSSGHNSGHRSLNKYSVYYDDEDENGKVDLKTLFTATTTTEPSPVYRPGGLARVRPIVPVTLNPKPSSVDGEIKTNNSQFICIELVDGKITHPALHKEIFPELKVPSFVMPTIPRIPLSYKAYKNYDSTNEKHTKVNLKNGQNVDSLKRKDHYVQRYYPVRVKSLESVKESKMPFTLAPETLNRETTKKTRDFSTTELPIMTTASNNGKVQPITYTTTVIIPKITATTVSLSTNYPKSTSPITTKQPTKKPGKDRNADRSEIMKSSEIGKIKKEKKEKKEQQEVNPINASSQQLSLATHLTNRVRFPKSEKDQLDTADDISLEAPTPGSLITEEPLIVPSTSQRPGYHSPSTHQSDRYRFIPEVLHSSQMLGHEITHDGLIDPTSEMEVSRKRPKMDFSPNKQVYHPYFMSDHPVPYTSYERPINEAVYKVNNPAHGMLYYEPRYNYKPEPSLVSPYMANVQRTFIRQRVRKPSRHRNHYNNYLAASASMVNTRKPRRLIQTGSSDITSQFFYPIYQQLPGLEPLTHSGFQLRPESTILSPVHQISPNYLNSFDNYFQTSSAGGRSLLSTSLSKNRRNRSHKSGSKKSKNRRKSPIRRSNQVSMATSASEPKSNPCPLGNPSCQNSSVFSPPRAVKFELRDARN